MSARAKRNLLLIGVAAICCAFLQNGRNILAPFVADIIADFSAEPSTTVILIQTIPGLGMVIGSLLYGALSRGMTTRAILILTSCVYAAASVIPVFLGHLLIPLLIVRVFMGIGCGLFAAMAVALVAANFDEKRSASFMGYLVAAQSIAMIAFETVAGFIGQNNWRIALPLGLVCVPVLIFGLIVLPKEDLQGKQMDSELRAARKKEIKAIPLFKKYPPVFFLWCVEMFFFFAGLTVIFVNSSIMVEASGFGDVWDAVIVLNLHTGFGFLISLVFGKLYARVKDYMLLIAALVATASCIGIFLSPSFVWMCIGASVFGLAGPSFLATLYQLAGKRINPLVSATATSILLAVQQLGGLLMAYFVEPLCKLFSLNFAGGRDPFLVYTAIFFLMSAVVLVQLLVARRKKAQEDSA